jgi:hypothetical protein
MSRYVGYCLAFAAACLLTEAGLNAAAWIACLRANQHNCETPLAAAGAALTGAANAALGVALQDRMP